MSENKEKYSEKDYPSSDDIFDLDKIPMEVLDEGYQSYRPYLKNLNTPNEDSSDDWLTVEEFRSFMIEEIKRIYDD